MVKCDICGQEFEGKREKQSLVLHKERKHGLRKVKGKDEYVKISEMEQPYEGNWRLLDENDQDEKACIDAGYKECYEVSGIAKVDWELR